MYSLGLAYIYLILRCFLVSSTSSCFDQSLQKSQDCANKNLLYFEIEGMASGLGSEFNFYLVHTLLDGIKWNKRLVYVKTGKEWHYDCPSKGGWSCFLEFPCVDSVIDKKDVVLSNKENRYHNKDDASRNWDTIKKSLIDIYENNVVNSQNKCDTTGWNPTVITSLAAKHLYRLNSNTRAFVDIFNSHYNLTNKEYLAIQIRATDKQVEMDPDTWSVMSNVTAIVNDIRPFLSTAGNELNQIFVATDDCSIMKEFKSHFDHNIYKVHSACHNSFAAGTPDRSGGYKQTLRLLAEVEMLLHGSVLFGVVHSNLVRMVYRLRSLDRQKTFHPFAEKFLKDRNLQLDNLLQ